MEKSISKILTILMLAGFLTSCGNDSKKTSNKDSLKNTTMDKKETVSVFFNAVLKGDTATVRELTNSDYIQHNPFIPTGLEPFIQMFPILQESGTTAENVRMFQDGNFVFMHNIWRNATPFGAEEMVSFDIIRLDENGKVAEHWDAMTVLVKETASGRTQTDGPTTVEDLDKTEVNKVLAVSLVEDVLMGKNPSKIGDYISSEE